MYLKIKHNKFNFSKRTQSPFGGSDNIANITYVKIAIHIQFFSESAITEKISEY